MVGGLIVDVLVCFHGTGSFYGTGPEKTKAGPQRCRQAPAKAVARHITIRDTNS
jgi:hypothetical protein